MKKFLWLGAVLFFIAALFVPLTKTHALDPEAVVAYEADDYIWEINVATKNKIKIGKGNFPGMSDKFSAPSQAYAHNEIAYVLTKENSHFDAKTDKEGIYIYNSSSGNTTYINYPVADTTDQVMFSPSGKYLLVGTHISTYETKTLITRKGKIKMSFKLVGEQFRWINDNKIVYTSLHNVVPVRPRGTGGGSGFGISKITTKGKVTVLKTPNALTDYLLFGMDGNKIQFIKHKTAKQDDWKYDNYKTSYWKMNQNGKNVKKTYKLVAWEKKIKNALPKKYKNYQVFDYGAPLYEIDYRLFVMNKGYNVNDEEVYVMKVFQPDTLKKLTKGHTPSWGWSLN